jgi:hypothetical protein
VGTWQQKPTTLFGVINMSQQQLLTHKELETTIQAACRKAAEVLGDRMLGMSCYLKNWQKPPVSVK